MDSTRRITDHQAYAHLVATMFFWSLNYILVASYRDQIPPVMMSFFRWSFALLMLLPFAARALVAEWPKIRSHWWQLFILGAFSCGLNSAFAFIGIHYTTVTSASLLSAMTPILTILLAVPLSHERMSPGRLAGVMTSFAGVVCIVTKGELATLLEFRLSAGDFSIILASAIWGVFTNLLRRWSAHLSQLASLATMMIGGVISLLPMLAIEAVVAKPVQWSSGLLVSLLVLAFFPSLLANLFWNRAVLAVGPGRASAFSYLLPLISIGFAVLVLGETLFAYHWLGAALIFLGITLVNRAR
ncbi:MAG: DMT family transporter [Burkholderiales bacterium]